MIPIWSGKVDQRHGDLHIQYDRAYAITNYLKGLEQQRVEVVIRKYKSKRSNEQNKYYFGVVLDILSKHTGYEPDEMHEILKFKFLRKRISNDVEYVQSTTKLNTAEMEAYLDKVRRWAAIELLCNIPLPNECEAA
jgi:hypothetical protein